MFFSLLPTHTITLSVISALPVAPVYENRLTAKFINGFYASYTKLLTTIMCRINNSGFAITLLGFYSTLSAYR